MTVVLDNLGEKVLVLILFDTPPFERGRVETYSIDCEVEEMMNVEPV